MRRKLLNNNGLETIIMDYKTIQFEKFCFKKSRLKSIINDCNDFYRFEQ